MRIRSYYALALLATLVVALGVLSNATYYVGAAQQAGSVNEYGKVPYCVGIVKYPNWGLPDVAYPGSSMDIHLWSNVGVKDAVLENSSFKVKLKLIRSSEGIVKAELPKSVGPGIYDLVLSTNEGTCGIHNAVWVPAERFNSLGSALVLMHVTDNHFNVMNPEGRPAADYVLSSVLLALSMPNITAIVNTGDLANTGSASQYVKAIEVFSLLNKPVFSIPGNHDHVVGIKNYELYVGPTNWSLRLGRFLLVGMDTGYDGYPTTAEAEWAYKVLTGSNATAEILMFHHPLFAYVYGSTPHNFNVSSWQDLEKVLLSKKPGSKYPYLFTSWLQNKKAFETILKAIYGSHTVLVLAGHIHLDSYALIERPNHVKTWFIVTTALGGPVRSKDYHGFRIIKVYGNGTVQVYGEGKPWDRHASYSVEGVKAYLNVGSAASAEALTITDPKIAAMLPHVVLAVPIPRNFEGKYKVFAPGADRVWRRCTPVFCAVYAEFKEVKLGKTYRLVAYVRPDEAPPTIVVRSAPHEVLVGRSIDITYSVKDEAWGVQETSAVVMINGEREVVKPMLYGGSYLISFLAPKTPGKVTVVITAKDFSGKTANKTVVINVVSSVSTTSSTVSTTTSSTTSTTSTPLTTSTRTSTTRPSITSVRTTSVAKPTPTTTSSTFTSTTSSITSTTKPSSTVPSASAVPAPVIAGGVVAVAVVAVALYLVLRRAQR